MTIAADLCVYTNHNFIIEILDANEPDPEEMKKEDSGIKTDSIPESVPEPFVPAPSSDSSSDSDEGDSPNRLTPNEL